MKDWKTRIAFAIGLVASVLLSRRISTDSYRALSVILAFFALGMYVLRRVAETNFQETLGRYGYPFFGGIIVAALSKALLLPVWPF